MVQGQTFTKELFMSAIEAVESDFDTVLRKQAQFINYVLKQLLSSRQINDDLKEAMSYTLFAPGKRIRSALVLWSCEVVSKPSAGINRNAQIAAAAIEMVHTYSLIHDDLPAMDNDDLRRGLPTCHKAFDEATAILTGDALLTLAFEILAKEIDDPSIAARLISELAEAAGPSGMVAGQMADLKAEGNAGNEEIVQYIHLNKTAKMFRCAAAMGAICGGAVMKEYERLCEYGLKLGLGFQIADDILDVTGSSEQLGKTAGKDAKAAKCTYPAVVGMKKAKELERRLTDEALAALKPFDKKADILRQLAMALTERTK
jgi:geranylgeranyl pyrophosphate synthase